MDKTKVGSIIREGRWGWLGWGGEVGGKGRKLYLNNSKKKILMEKNIAIYWTLL